MKNLIILILCFITSKTFSQTNEIVFQEKASDWIKVTSTPLVSKPKSKTVIKRKTSSKKPAVLKRKVQEEFEKTNSQVNRFKKGKKD